MSLNQAFLKIFSEDGYVSEMTKCVPSPQKHRVTCREEPIRSAADEMNYSFRVDQYEDPVQVSSRFEQERPEGIFSFEEEKRRRNPIPEPELEDEYWEKRVEAGEEICALAGAVSNFGKKRSYYESSEKQRSAGSACQSRKEISEQEVQTASGFDIDELIASSAAVRMREWPADYRKIYERGSAEFAELAEAIEETFEQGNRIFGFGGWGDQTGVSTLLLGLLYEMTRRHRKVLLVDANFHHPDLAKILGVPVTSGWEGLLYPESGSESGLVRVDSPDFPFFFLPLADGTVSDAVAAASKKRWFQSFLELTECFDMVLVDHGSFRTDSDREKVFEILRFGSDGYFMVTDKRSPFNEEASEFSAVSNGCRLSCFGVIENFT